MIQGTQKTGQKDPPTKAETTHPKNWPKRPETTEHVAKTYYF